MKCIKKVGRTTIADAEDLLVMPMYNLIKYS